MIKGKLSGLSDIVCRSALLYNLPAICHDSMCSYDDFIDAWHHSENCRVIDDRCLYAMFSQAYRQLLTLCNM